MPIDSLDKIPILYHFTDRRNIASIVQHGGLHPYSELVTKGIAIPAPGGNDWSHDADKLFGVDSYVHLCLRNQHPMEHVARQDGRLTDSVFIQVNPAVLQFDGVRFTDDVSNKSGVKHVPISEAALDYEVLYTRTEWKDPNIQARLRKMEKCEVLVPRVIPLEYLRIP